MEESTVVLMVVVMEMRMFWDKFYESEYGDRQMNIQLIHVSRPKKGHLSF